MLWFLDHFQEIGLLIIGALHLVPDSKGIGVIQTVIERIIGANSAPREDK